MTGAPPFDAVVLAGGKGSRLGGLDKATIPIGGLSLLDRVLAAVAAAEQVVVAGPARAVGGTRRITWVDDEAPGGGPVGGLAAALPELRAEVVVLLATDLPFVTGAAVDALRAALATAPPGTDAVVGVDAGGREQWLLGAWRRERLTAAVAALGDPSGRALRDVASALGVGTLELDRALAGTGPWFDVDTAEDLAVARRVVE